MKRGFSLVEVMQVLVLGSGLMVLAVHLLERTMQVQETALSGMEQVHDWSALCLQLRRDAHLAEAVVEIGSRKLTLATGPAAIEYIRDERGLLRISRAAETIEYQHFSLPADAVIDFQAITGSDRVLLTVHSLTPNNETRQVLQIEAAVGRWANHPTRDPQ
ncbi:MAG: hypothetical protein KatS3mg111_3937 [Pirellulaceae bacterium]|nr:MAG: hypothetical protein KatS3mg111_3937 [Pirellulaceae bacterium]